MINFSYMVCRKHQEKHQGRELFSDWTYFKKAGNRRKSYVHGYNLSMHSAPCPDGQTSTVEINLCGSYSLLFSKSRKGLNKNSDTVLLTLGTKWHGRNNFNM